MANHGATETHDLTAQLEHRERQIEAIRRTSDALFSHPNVDTLVEVILRLALDVVRADSGTVYLYDPANDTLVFRYVIGPAADQLIGRVMPASQGVAGAVFRTAVPELVPDVTIDPRFNYLFDEKYGYRTKSMMTAPIKRTGGTPVGVMQVLNATIPFTLHDLEVLEVLCAQVATGIEHARLVEAQRNAEIGNRVGEIAHDIKNMMTPIETGVMTLQPMLTDMFQAVEQLVERCPENEGWGKELSDATAGTGGLYSWLLDDLLTAAKRVRRRTEYIAGMVKGTLPPPVFEKGALTSVANDVLKTLKKVATDRGITLKGEFAPGLPQIAFDYDRLYDCLYNLVNNALPETPSGGSVTLRITAADPGVQIEVVDTGRGMPEDVRAKLFTKEAISTKPGGTGLGTSVAARVAHEHGGTIAVASEIGVGTTFTIRLPLEPPT